MKPVLLVSRDPGQRQELAGYLTQWDCRVDACENSVQAFAALMRASAEGRSYRRILVDCRGLDMPPRQFIASLQAEPSLEQLPLALITAPMPELEQQQLLDAGYLGIVESPLDKPRLFRALNAEPGAAPRGANLLSLNAHQRQRSIRLPAQEILLAEPCGVTRRNLARILSKAGHNVYPVRDGEEALDALERYQFDLVILEWEMPSVSGADVARMHSFSGNASPHTRFLFVTSGRGTSPYLPRLGINPKTVLTKPVPARTLLEAIQATLETRPRAAPDAATPDASRQIRRALLNRAVLDSLSRLAPAPSFVEQLIEEFIRDGSKRINRLQQAAQELDYAGFQAAAHALVDNAGHLGASSLHHSAGKAMRLSRNGFHGQAIALAKEAADGFEATRRALIEYLQRHTGASRS
jgi:CheY-like chemotaxis protein/HPt (histidine-containing phosphotransfer) domain-containing protein